MDTNDDDLVDTNVDEDIEGEVSIEEESNSTGDDCTLTELGGKHSA